MSTPRKKITITYYYDIEWKQLYGNTWTRNPTATKFFTDEQTREFDKQVKQIEDTKNKPKE